MARFQPQSLRQIPRGFLRLTQGAQRFRAQMPDTRSIGGKRQRRIKIFNRFFRQARIQIPRATLHQKPRGG